MNLVVELGYQLKGTRLKDNIKKDIKKSLILIKK